VYGALNDHRRRHHESIEDATIADTMLDRIMQRHHRFTLTGDSLRQAKPKPATDAQ
jgi:DNA replication protein DnaC